jgi:hypothetical protein
VERLRSPWHNPFAAPVRHLFGGVLVGGVLIGAFLGARTLLEEQPPHPDEWLTTDDQEALVAAISSVPVDGWVAGCLWKDRDPGDVHSVVEHPDGGIVQTWRWSGVRDGLQVCLVSVEDATPESENFNEVSGSGYFCCVPE